MIISINFDSKRTLTILMLVLSMFILSNSAHAITRGCDGNYKIYPKNNAHNVIYSSTFGARAGCGRFVPNRCRKRAREKLHQCMKAHWNVKKKSYAPDACRKVSNYPFNNLNKELRHYICHTYNVKNMYVDIYAHTYGRERCGSTRLLKSSLRISCNKKR